jgi:hypothetical protein
MNIDDEKKFSWKSLTGVLIALATVILIELLFSTTIIPDIFGTTIFQTTERRSLDLLMKFRGVRENAGDVIMVRIDEYTAGQIGFPMRRDYYGAVMSAISNSGAKAVALDIFLSSSDDADSTENALLIKQLSYAKNTYQTFGPFISWKTAQEPLNPEDIDTTAIYAISKFGVPAPRNHHFPRAPFIEAYPFAELADVSTGIGHIILINDTLDGVIRAIPLYVEYAGKLYPSIGFALAMKTLNIQPSKVKFVDIWYRCLCRSASHSYRTSW